MTNNRHDPNKPNNHHNPKNPSKPNKAFNPNDPEIRNNINTPYLSAALEGKMEVVEDKVMVLEVETVCEKQM